MEKYIESLVSIVIPSLNRHKYLYRLLNYYKNWNGSILVADSTSNEFAFKNQFNCDYFHYPDKRYVEKFCDIILKVKTPYIVFCGDDDFIVPSSIIKCVLFLEKNKQYAVADGKYIKVYNKLKIEPLMPYSFNESISSDINNHLTKLFSEQVNCFYGVNRTVNLKDIAKYLMNNNINEILLVEYVFLFFIYIKGGYKQFPYLHGIRTDTPRCNIEKINLLNEINKNEFNVFQKTIIDYIISNHKISKQEAEKTFKMSFELWNTYSPKYNYYPPEYYEENKKNVVFRMLTKYKNKIKIFGTILNHLHNKKFINNYKYGYPFGHDNFALREWKKVKKIIKSHDVS